MVTSTLVDVLVYFELKDFKACLRHGKEDYFSEHLMYMLMGPASKAVKLVILLLNTLWDVM